MRKIKKLLQSKSFFFGVPGGIRTPDRSVRSWSAEWKSERNYAISAHNALMCMLNTAI